MSKPAFYKIYYTTKHLLKTSCCLEIMGTHQMVPTQSQLFFPPWVPNTQQKKWIVSWLWWKLERQSVIYTSSRDTFRYGKQYRMSLYPECSEQHIYCGATFDTRYKLLPSLSLNFNVGTSWGYCLIAQHSSWMHFTLLWNILLTHSVSLLPPFTTIRYCCKKHKNDSLKVNNSREGK